MSTSKGTFLALGKVLDNISRSRGDPRSRSSDVNQHGCGGMSGRSPTGLVRRYPSVSIRSAAHFHTWAFQRPGFPREQVIQGVPENQFPPRVQNAGKSRTVITWKPS